MAQTGTTVISLESSSIPGAAPGPRIIKLVWVCSAGGVVTSGTDSSGYSNFWGQGTCVAAVFSDTGATAAYDVTITDARGLDILNGAGANVAGGTSTTVVQNTATQVMAAPATGYFTLNVANAGNATTGTIYLYIR